MNIPFLNNVILSEPQITEHHFEDINGLDSIELILLFHINTESDDVIKLYKTPYFLYVNKDILKIRIPLYKGELKLYFENYHDYYYLPDEDQCILKSIAASVDTSHRQNAKKETCYIKYNGLFIPNPMSIDPTLKKNYKDRYSYMPYDNQKIQSLNLISYASAIIQYMNQ